MFKNIKVKLMDNANANYDDKIGKTTPVGKYPPNPLGIYDMSGNVWEWCEDVYDEHAYSKHGRKNPIYRGNSVGCVIRGGGWYSLPENMLCSNRNAYGAGYRSSDIGFRLVCK